jgi:hypothetical protein
MAAARCVGSGVIRAYACEAADAEPAELVTQKS